MKVKNSLIKYINKLLTDSVVRVATLPLMTSFAFSIC